MQQGSIAGVVVLWCAGASPAQCATALRVDVQLPAEGELPRGVAGHVVLALVGERVEVVRAP